MNTNIVFIGGGNGVTNIAPVLRDFAHVCAIVTTFDSGGSYGRLRYDYKNPLSGDVRRALAALSTNQWGKLTEYRFPHGAIQGHTLGNLILAGLFDQSTTAEIAMAKLHDLFAVKGEVLPVSYDLCDIIAELKDRSIIRGEHTIDEPHAKSHVAIQRIWLDPEPVIAPGVIEAIRKSDLIIMGPGDVYTSIIPNLLVSGVTEEIKQSKAKKIYFCNAFTKFGQTNRYTAFDHVKAIESYLDGAKFDTVVLCTSTIPDEVIKHHQEQNEQLVLQDEDVLIQDGYHVIKADLLQEMLVEQSVADALKRSKIKFDVQKLLNLFQTEFHI